jgi:FkbM family methyltransferase
VKNLLRKTTLQLLKAFQRDMNIRHHWVSGRRLVLNSYLHKGYWYWGKKREFNTMLLFSRIIENGMTVAEVGGHIGYLTNYFSFLVGSSGKVIVFEPGSNNLPYIRKNIQGLGNVTLVEKGIGEKSEELMFFEDSLIGQNNSFVANFEGLHENEKAAFTHAQINNRKVTVISLDSFFSAEAPDFIKIDIEGYEYFALKGSMNTFKSQPIVMVEVQANREEIYAMFNVLIYMMFDENRAQAKVPQNLNGNMFCLHKTKHAEILQRIFCSENA